MTTGAHIAAGGGVPRGPALIVALLMCVTAGALVARVRCGGLTGYTAIAAALAGAQLDGHVTRMVGAHQHHSAAGQSWFMPAAHLGAAALLGAAITSVEYLYAVCVSVLCWLRLFTLRAPRASSPVIQSRPNVVVRQPVLSSGLGMRAPPAVA
jgi:hypothetical protein